MTKPALLALVALLTGAVDAQAPAPSAGRQFSAAPESFDAASIKPHVAGARPAIRVTRSGIDFMNTSLREIVQTAYQLLPQQISTTSDLSARYDVVARAGGSATREHVMAMLRTLLAERFHIRVHYEQREAQVFALVVGKGDRASH